MSPLCAEVSGLMRVPACPKWKSASHPNVVGKDRFAGRASAAGYFLSEATTPPPEFGGLSVAVLGAFSVSHGPQVQFSEIKYRLVSHETISSNFSRGIQPQKLRKRQWFL